MIDIRKLKELVRLMVANDLTEIDLRDTEEQVTIHRPSVYASPQVAAPAAAAPAPQSAPPAPVAAAPVDEPPAEDDTAGLVAVSSPMVGTFYAAATPDAPAFVSAGDSIGPDTVVCLVEAMKIFNEIKAECSGTIQKVLVNNGDAVEFGQDLFLVKPS
ncbi:MAG: acetyl-CoA carboxylase, biotin carboxyl carrier protein [Phycisphaerae bacterium]|nr:acetyl-CoA carboxylase, biotin carboxyl carrier protein [Phycisphaerae bacterium]|tara:strand:+ start:1569 stop:2042 length:474 start_codon:yes stop_codon:yes gene_type:complete